MLMFQGIQQLTEIFHQMGTLLSQKFGVSTKQLIEAKSPIHDHSCVLYMHTYVSHCAQLQGGQLSLLETVCIVTSLLIVAQIVVGHSVSERVTIFIMCVLQTSARCVTQDGSYSPVLDKPDTALDLVQDAVIGCGYTLGTDVDIILNCAASDFYDQVY